jgi:hypothetical protein
VTLWLHPTAHHTERTEQFVITRQQTRNDGVVRSLAAGETIGVARFKAEIGATIL